MLRNKNITISELANELNISTRAIEKQINKLKQTGAIERVRSDREGYWKVINHIAANHSKNSLNTGVSKF